MSLRHSLDDPAGFLRLAGGHIGYAVRPAHRRQGYATEILRQSLTLATGRGIDPALVTCDDNNVASAAVIERCGGVLDGIVTDPKTGAPKRRYWVPTS
jgi:predicted acetyltransferase